MGVLNEITRDELESVFDEWMARLDACVQGGGDDVEEQESIEHRFALFYQSHRRILNNNGTPCTEVGSF
jgi:iron only hydrogenase large subunit-like protein